MMPRTQLFAALFISLCALPGIAADRVDQAVATGHDISLKRQKERLAELKSEEFRRWKAQASDKSQDRAKRALAVLRIAELGSEQSASFLAEVWDAPLDVLHHEKLSLVDWAGEFGGDACVPMLRQALTDPGRDERWHAARALARIQGTKALPLLTELSENDPDEIVRSQTKEFIADAVSREENLSDHWAVVRAVIDWGRSRDAGPYIKDDVAYLLRDSHPSDLEAESLRLYSMTELKLLDKTFDAYAIHSVGITGDEATAVLAMALIPPIDPVPFPFSGWTLGLEKKHGKWSVSKAVKNEPTVGLNGPANKAIDGEEK